jgi:hypothetical protein
MTTKFSLRPDVSFRSEADVGWAAEFTVSVENDPKATLAKDHHQHSERVQRWLN